MNIRLSMAFFSCLILSAALLFGPGSARAQDYNAGMAAFEAGDFERAVGIWDPLALAGDATAQYSLGKIYETGNMDLERDYGRAVEWYRLAAAQGVAAAQNNLGLMYAQGRGVARDVGRAAELWSAASKQNHDMAQFNLGLAYFRGEGLAENKQEAESRFRQAAKLGLAEAQYALGQVRLHGLTAEADRGEALAWYQLAAAQGHVKAREQAKLLRDDGVKPHLNVALAAPAKTQSAQAPSKQQAAQAPAAQKTAVEKPAAKQDLAKTRIAPTAPAAKAAPSPKPAVASAKPEMPVAPASKPSAAPSTPAPQIKTQVARAGAGAVPSGAGGKVKAWLYSAASEGEAVLFLRRMENRLAPLLTGIDSAVAPVRFSDGKVFYRVVAGGFNTWDDGKSWCDRVTSREPDTFCKVLPSP